MSMYLDELSERNNFHYRGLKMDYTIIVSIGLGSLISLISVTLGGWLVLGATKRLGSILSPVPDPAGDVFTIEDAGDALPFPEAGNNSADEEHVIDRTNKFLDMFAQRGTPKDD